MIARVIAGLTDFEGFEPKGRTVKDKLTSLGIELVERFIDDTVGITRATIAEADRFPALSRHVHEHGRDRAAAAVSHVLNDTTHTLSRGAKGPFSTKRSLSTAQIFMDLILLPMMMRALMGEDAKHLRSELPAFVRERVNFFLAACETDWASEALARHPRQARAISGPRVFYNRRVRLLGCPGCSAAVENTALRGAPSRRTLRGLGVPAAWHFRFRRSVSPSAFASCARVEPVVSNTTRSGHF